MPRGKTRLANVRLPAEHEDVDRLQTLRGLLFQIRGGIDKIKSRKYHNRLRTLQIQVDQATNLIKSLKTQITNNVSHAAVNEKLHQLVTSIANVPFVANIQSEQMQNAVWVLVN